MTRPGILTLTTDFGFHGPYVAAVKGVILAAPGVQLVDVSHSIAPQNILEGAFVLSGIVEAFPPETVHLAVIDPGVGTDRRLIAARLAEQWFVVPDNGLLSGVVRGRTPAGVWEITNPALRLPKVSATFHGRDILAPAAAHLLRGGDPAELGPTRAKFITLSNFEPNTGNQGIIGEVIFRDAFGNLITNVSKDRVASVSPESWTIEVGGEQIKGLCQTYSDRPSGTLIALVGSSGWIEIAVANGNAARHLMADLGTTVWFRKGLATE